MTTTPEMLEQRLAAEVRSMEVLLDDESFCTELYRALADVKWSRGGEAVSVSWKRAEEIINGTRAARGLPALTLAQTGGEGEVSDRIAEALAERGWSPRPLNTGRHDDAHVGSPEGPPPPDTGARQAPVDDPHAWEREGHEQAQAARLRHGR